MDNRTPLNSSGNEQSNILASTPIRPHEDGVDYAFSKRDVFPEEAYCGSLPPPQAPLHLAGSDVAAAGARLLQQSRNDNIEAIGLQFRPLIDAPESQGRVEDFFLPSDPPAIETVPNIQPTHAGYASPLPPPGLTPQEKEKVMELPNGTFCCSALGCWEIYRRSGDCRRHLKKHNGPFTLCPVPNCGMQFHRDDKLRDHLRQRHLIVLTAPPRGQHLADLVTYLPSGFLYLGGYYEAEA